MVLGVGVRVPEGPIAFFSKVPNNCSVPKHYVTKLLIVLFHEKLVHTGHNHTLASLGVAVLDSNWKISCTQCSAIVPVLQKTECSCHGTNDDSPISIFNYCIWAMFHSYRSGLFWILECQARKSCCQALWRHFHLPELETYAFTISQVLGIRLLH